MTKTRFFSIFAAVFTTAISQPMAAQPNPDISAQQEAMAALSFMVGTWEGEGEMRRGPEPESSQVLEQVTMKLDGTALLIEGLGTYLSEDDEVKTAHQAIGLIWYNAAENRYQMKALTPGRETDADFELTDNGVVWGFSTPGGEVRYTAEFTDDIWAETGQFSRDGETWTPFFSMQLLKVGEIEEPSS